MDKYNGSPSLEGDTSSVSSSETIRSGDFGDDDNNDQSIQINSDIVENVIEATQCAEQCFQERMLKAARANGKLKQPKPWVKLGPALVDMLYDLKDADRYLVTLIEAYQEKKSFKGRGLESKYDMVKK